MPDRAALNLASLGPAPLESKLYAAAAAGFRAVGLVREEMQKAGEDGQREVRLSQLAAAWEIIELAEAPNGGLVIDAFHFHRGGSSPEMLVPVTGDKIFLVQISDAVDLPVRDLHDRHRVYPGSGAIPLEPLLSAVRDKGYSSYYSLELHNEGYWQQDPLLVAREGFRAVSRFDLS